MIENIIIGVMTGIISGGYTGLVISKYILFTSLRREALRIIRRIDYIDGQGYSNYESLPEMVLISSDFLSLNHQKAGDSIMGVFNKINTEISMRPLSTNGDIICEGQKTIRSLPANIWVLINPFSLRV
ncbi:hypothetical protein [Yersinia enterocolitica]|uniref:hypothetical protein n=1 Tax=Yersinia enterocolitica TaxID=630 RepID=UPI0009F65131|nr:hypothetical protein [Yersinia enterocolitica]PNM19800.1 hypothetical protein A6J65_013655 [Yersinia enterocolitica]